MPRAGNVLRVPQRVRKGLEPGHSAQPGPDPHPCCLPHHPGRNRSLDAPGPGVRACCPQPGLRRKLASASSARSCACRSAFALHLDTRRPGVLAATALTLMQSHPCTDVGRAETLSRGARSPGLEMVWPPSEPTAGRGRHLRTHLSPQEAGPRVHPVTVCEPPRCQPTHSKSCRLVSGADIPEGTRARLGT